MNNHFTNSFFNFDEFRAGGCYKEPSQNWRANQIQEASKVRHFYTQNSANTSKSSKNTYCTTKNTFQKFNIFIFILCELWTHWYAFVDIHIKNLWAKEPEFPSWPVWHSRRIPTSWCPDLRMDLFIFMSFQILTLFTHWGTFHYYIVKPMRLRHC